jgi:hypothetical protein
MQLQGSWRTEAGPLGMRLEGKISLQKPLLRMILACYQGTSRNPISAIPYIH